MAKLFSDLREQLLRAGVAPRHVRRYLIELADHLADLKAEQERACGGGLDAESAALARLGGTDDLAKAMIQQRQFQSWSVRAPWAIFGLAPPFFLASAYFIACSILWSGWKIFLPGSTTPFIRVYGLAIFYFGIGRWLYFGAPILIGWGIGLIAARQRFKSFWPVVGLVLIALVGGAAHVEASLPIVAGGVGNISMRLYFGPSAQDLSHAMIQSLVIFLLALFPPVIWRLKRTRLGSA